MDNLRRTIEVLFHHFPITDLIGGFESALDGNGVVVDESSFSRLFCQNNYATIDEAKLDYDLFVDTKNDTGILSVLNSFSKQVLCLTGDYPMVQHEHLFRWREISSIIGEDVFICSYLAEQDLKNGYQRPADFFSWEETTKSDDTVLKALRQSGYSELHFHLKGSSATFPLSWICLMNNIDDHRSDRNLEFDSLDRCHANPWTVISSSQALDFYQIAILASYLRINMFLTLKGEEIYSPTVPLSLENKHCSELQSSIERARDYFGQTLYTKEKLDYALSAGDILLKDEPVYALYGERLFLYNAFKRVYSNDKRYIKPLYLYLLARTKIRNEILQTNHVRGFANFDEYNERKNIFIKAYSEYNSLVAPLAYYLCYKEGAVSYLESRVCLEKKPLIQIDKLFKCGQYPGFEKQFIVHFIKKNGRTENLEDHTCRNHATRSQVKDQALLFVSAYENNGEENKPYFVGIDAANTEIGCRPEVFAQAFRYIRAKCHIGYTYHVGEDFFDLLDGLRAIDECVQFMEYQSGDRLGHCLALGIDPFDYYQERHHLLLLDRITLIDNAAWFLRKIKEYGIFCNSSFYDDEFKKQCQYVYGALFDPDVYYNSMRLRGNSTENFSPNNVTSIQDWGRFDFIDNTINLYQDPVVLNLYKRYHTDSQVKTRGAEVVEIKVPDSIHKTVREIQDKMISELEGKQIHIECCPTSNVKIGKIGKYELHPIFRFYDRGLAVISSAQLSVSINTDDLGVFATSLDSEYSLIAHALRKQKDEYGTRKYRDGVIQEWLESIRRYAEQSRFKH